MVSESKKERWRERREQQREQYAEAQRRRKMRRVAILALVIVATLAIAFFVYKRATGPGEYDAFAQCMTENGMTMYGTDWCPHCQRQKQMFGRSFKYINYVNCDIGTACDEAGVEAYPTWGKDGELQPSGVKPLAELARLSGCRLP